MPRGGKRREAGRGTLLFVDEIHRFNRAQQDAFLPYVEDGTVVLIGATTRTPPSSSTARSSRAARSSSSTGSTIAALETMLQRAEAQLGRALPLEPEARLALRTMADGDGRFLLNLVEELARLPAGQTIDIAALTAAVQRRAPLYDKAQEGHYNLISALHKSLRGSDADAALYWLARMLAGGEDPIYILRRLTLRAAVEDIGLAEPNALPQAIAAWEAYDRLGSPRASLRWRNSSSISRRHRNRTPPNMAFGAAGARRATTGSLMAAPSTSSTRRPAHARHRLRQGLRVTTTRQRTAFRGKNYFPDGMERQEFYAPAIAASSARSRSGSTTGRSCGLGARKGERIIALP